jgi:hypothetical protein
MDLANILRLGWAPNIIGCIGPRSFTTDRLFRARGITLNSVQPFGFTVYIGNTQHTTHYFAHEADRFATAAFESVTTLAKSQNQARSVAWMLIQTYYSAFFAVHALLRIRGWACTRLTSANLASLNSERALFFPHAENFNAGLYWIKIDHGGRELQCKKLDSATGGTHELLWSLLQDYLADSTAMALANRDVDAQDYAALVQRFTDFVAKHGGDKWFTSTRNRINYSHEFGTWFPYNGSTCDWERVSLEIQKWRDPANQILDDTKGDELMKFARACAFLIAMCRTTIEDLAFRSKSRSPFCLSSHRLI